ncbi:MAG: hypothetical protein KAV00_05405 [Phycisphaerae bacterium]|nr:hypothetical protein [Phycisphaerae bacterium]
MATIESKVPITALTEGPKNHFFGDYGRSPWCPRDRRVLVLRTDLYDRAPGPEDVAEVGYIDMDNPGSFTLVNTTFAWNWQRGSMQCWVVKGRSEYIIHNSRIDGRFVGTMVDLDDGSKTHLPLPVFSVDSKGRYALSLNFARLHELRPGYGFAGVDDEYHDVLTPEDDGISLIDLETHECRLLLSLKEIASFQAPPHSEGLKHWVNDLVFAPGGEKFCFLHRCWMRDGNILSRFMACDIDGNNLRVLYNGTVSHFAWRNDGEIIAWAGQRKLLNTMRKKGGVLKGVLKLAKPMYHMLGEPKFLKSKLLKEAYFIIYDSREEPVRIGCPELYQDGHCSFDSSGRWFVTDTYPNRRGRMSLLLCCLENNSVVRVAELDSDRTLKSDYRCDLHPRWNHASTMICFDSTHQPGRQMYLADVSSVMSTLAGQA